MWPLYSAFTWRVPAASTCDPGGQGSTPVGAPSPVRGAQGAADPRSPLPMGVSLSPFLSEISKNSNNKQKPRPDLQRPRESGSRPKVDGASTEPAAGSTARSRRATPRAGEETTSGGPAGPSQHRPEGAQAARGDPTARTGLAGRHAGPVANQDRPGRPRPRGPAAPARAPVLSPRRHAPAPEAARCGPSPPPGDLRRGHGRHRR